MSRIGELDRRFYLCTLCAHLRIQAAVYGYDLNKHYFNRTNNNNKK